MSAAALKKPRRPLTDAERRERAERAAQRWAAALTRAVNGNSIANFGLIFAGFMARELPRLSDVGRRQLLTYAKRHYRYQEMRCGDGSQDQERNAELAELAELETPNLRALIEALIVPAGGGVVFGGDPRGCTVKITVPSGKTDDWGEDGICVPGG